MSYTTTLEGRERIVGPSVTITVDYRGRKVFARPFINWGFRWEAWDDECDGAMVGSAGALELEGKAEAVVREIEYYIDEWYEEQEE